MHHTKDKGDIGTTTIIHDLTKRGFDIFVPIGEPTVDLVALRGDEIQRIQVKYRTVKRGAMEVVFNNSWGNASRGTVTGKRYSKQEIDYFAITDGVNIAYVSYNDETLKDGSVRIRVEPTKNNQAKGVRYLSEYQDI